MDLVKAYDSEMEDNSSDIEEIGQVTSATPKSAEIDVIELSDSDDEIAKEKEEATQKNAKEKEETTQKNEKSTTSTISEVDCIDLEDSSSKRPCINLDSDSPEKSSPMKRTCEVPVTQPSNSTKNVDYLNLEGSESEEECVSSEKNISSLMDTASVLNEIPSGPEKPKDMSINADTVTENVPLTNQIDKIVAANLMTDSNSSRNTPDLAQNCLPHDSSENSLLSSCDKESNEAFPLVNNNTNTSETLSCIFRDDNRIVEASQKINLCRIPRQTIQTHNAHTKLITSLNWCIPKFSYLFLSASQDGSIKIWDLYRTNSVQCIKVNSGLNAAKWSLDGGQIIAGGFEKKAFVYDVQTGKQKHPFYSTIMDNFQFKSGLRPSFHQE